MLTTKVVGVSFGDRQTWVLSCAVGDLVRLEHHADSDFGDCVVMVIWVDSQGQEHDLGHLARDNAAFLVSFLEGRSLVGRIAEKRDVTPTHPYMGISVQCSFADVLMVRIDDLE